MEKKVIVITENGFITSKDIKDVLTTDDVICETHSQEETEQIIHGGYKGRL